jgi:hypothetical protein
MTHIEEKRRDSLQGLKLCIVGFLNEKEKNLWGIFSFFLGIHRDG